MGMDERVEIAGEFERDEKELVREETLATTG